MGPMDDHLPDREQDSANSGPVDRVLRQAPVDPLHDDGVRVFTIGTVLAVFAVAVLAMNGPVWGIERWWLHVAIAGVVIGALATAYCIWRRNKRAADAAAGIAPRTP